MPRAKNPSRKDLKYRLSGDNKPFQTTVIVHDDAVFIKLLGLHETTVDIDYLTACSNALLEGEGLEDIRLSLLVRRLRQWEGGEVRGYMDGFRGGYCYWVDWKWG